MAGVGSSAPSALQGFADFSFSCKTEQMRTSLLKTISKSWHCLSLLACVCVGIADGYSGARDRPRTYNYFAFGSNMASSTMINLRNLSPLASTAAVLPGHKLRFNLPGAPLIEPSSASVEPSSGDGDDVVHGVLFKLNEEDFATVCRTEGVPFAYVLHRCNVVTYTGDGGTAGASALRREMEGEGGQSRLSSVAAFTLRAARKRWREGRDIAPSRGYLNVLLRGAAEYRLDETYRTFLESIKPGMTIGNGLAEQALNFAEQRSQVGR